MIDGPQALVEFDLLAHKSLISEKYFESHILDHAQRCADQFCQALSPQIFSSGQTVRRSDSPSQYRRPTPSTPGFSARDLFHEAFVCALRLKDELLLSRRKYRLVFFRPDDKFCPTTMAQDGDLPDYVRPGKNGVGPAKKLEDGKIKFCLFPALYSGLEEKIDSIHTNIVDIEHCAVDYRNFETDRDIQGLTLVSKAVVLV